MNYEEKYKEALENLRKIKEENKDNNELVELIECKFPELAESLDEKIRKTLIRIFKRADMDGKIFGEGITFKQVVAWLEKQGEQIPANSAKTCKDEQNTNKYEGYCKDCNNVKGCVTCIDGDQWAHYKEVEQKPIEKTKHINHSYITPNQKFFQWIYDRLIHVHNENPNVDYMLSLKERIEDMQKSVWSKEDEKILKNLINDTEKTLFAIKQEERPDIMSGLSEIYIERLRWLKSIKDRI